MSIRFAYADSHRYQLGANYQILPIGRPKNEVVELYQRDGYMQFANNGGSQVNYEPNSFGGPKKNPDYAEPPLKINGDAARYNQSVVDDD